MSSRGGRSEGGMTEGQLFDFIAESYVMMLRGELSPDRITALNNTSTTWAQHGEKELEITEKLKGEIANTPSTVRSEVILFWLKGRTPDCEYPKS